MNQPCPGQQHRVTVLSWCAGLLSAPLVITALLPVQPAPTADSVLPQITSLRAKSIQMGQMPEP